MGPEAIIDLVEYEPDTLSITGTSRLALLSTVAVLTAMSSRTSTGEASSAVRRVSGEWQGKAPSKPSFDLLIAGFIARNVLVYDEDRGKWVTFDTWSKRVVNRVSPDSVGTPFGDDPIENTISLLSDPSPENIKSKVDPIIKTARGLN